MLVTMQELRFRLRAVIDDTIDTDVPTVITRHDRPVAVVVSARWFRENVGALPKPSEQSA